MTLHTSPGVLHLGRHHSTSCERAYADGVADKRLDLRLEGEHRVTKADKIVDTGFPGRLPRQMSRERRLRGLA
jgi:hypothetical protein